MNPALNPREPEDDRLPEPADRVDPGVVGGGAGPEDVPAESFEDIIAGWRREGRVPAWPDRPTVASATQAPPDTAPGISVPADEHFVPPDPPPLPRMGPPAVVGLALLAIGLILLIAPSVLGVSGNLGLPLGLLGLASGLGWLVLRLWPAPPPRSEGDGEDDGAVL